MTQDMTPTAAADMTPTAAKSQLTSSLATTGLAGLVRARVQRSLLMCDCSGSMADHLRSGQSKHAALQTVVSELRETHAVPLVAFGVRPSAENNYRTVEVVDTLPRPSGGTPLDEAIAFGQKEGATHLIVVTDGQPDSEIRAFEAARAFKNQIDVFYIGDGNDRGAKFAAELAKMTGGTANVTDLGQPKQLTSAIKGLLGAPGMSL